jgi:hypothetical protein
MPICCGCLTLAGHQLQAGFVLTLDGLWLAPFKLSASGSQHLGCGLQSGQLTPWVALAQLNWHCTAWHGFGPGLTLAWTWLCIKFSLHGLYTRY